MGEFIRGAFPKPIHDFFFGEVDQENPQVDKVDQVAQEAFQANQNQGPAEGSFYENVKAYIYNVGTGFSLIFNLFFCAGILSIEDCFYAFTQAGRASLVNNLKNSTFGIRQLLDNFDGFSLSDEDKVDVIKKGFQALELKAIDVFINADFEDQDVILDIFEGFNFNFYTSEEFNLLVKHYIGKLSTENKIKLYTLSFNNYSVDKDLAKTLLTDEGFIDHLEEVPIDVKRSFVKAIAGLEDISDLDLSKLKEEDVALFAELNIRSEIRKYVKSASDPWNLKAQSLDPDTILMTVASVYIDKYNMSKQCFFELLLSVLEAQKPLDFSETNAIEQLLEALLNYGINNQCIAGKDEDDAEAKALEVVQKIAKINIDLLFKHFESRILPDSEHKTFFGRFFLKDADNCRDLMSLLVEDQCFKSVERFLKVIGNTTEWDFSEGHYPYTTCMNHIAENYPLYTYVLAQKLGYFTHLGQGTFCESEEYQRFQPYYVDALRLANETLKTRSTRKFQDVDDVAELKENLKREKALNSSILSSLSKEEKKLLIKALFWKGGIFSLPTEESYGASLFEGFTNWFGQPNRTEYAELVKMKFLILSEFVSTKVDLEETVIPFLKKQGQLAQGGNKELYEEFALNLIASCPHSAIELLDVLIRENLISKDLEFLADKEDRISDLFNLDWRAYIAARKLKSLHLVDLKRLPNAKTLDFTLPKIPEDSSTEMDDLLETYEKFRKLFKEHCPEKSFPEYKTNLETYISKIRYKTVLGLSQDKTEAYERLEENLKSSIYALEKMLNSSISKDRKIAKCQDIFFAISESADKCVAPFQKNLPSAVLKSLKHYLPAASQEALKDLELFDDEQKLLLEEVKKVVGDYAASMADFYFISQNPVTRDTHSHTTFMSHLKKNVVNIPFANFLSDDDAYIAPAFGNNVISDANREKLIKDMSVINLIRLIQSDFAAKGLFTEKDEEDPVAWYEVIQTYIKTKWKGLPGKDYKARARENLGKDKLEAQERKFKADKKDALVKDGVLLQKLFLLEKPSPNAAALKKVMKANKQLTLDKPENYAELINLANIDCEAAEKEVEEVQFSKAQQMLKVEMKVNTYMAAGYLKTQEYQDKMEEIKEAASGDISELELKDAIEELKLQDGLAPFYADTSEEDWRNSPDTERGLSCFVVESLLRDAGILV